MSTNSRPSAASSASGEQVARLSVSVARASLTYGKKLLDSGRNSLQEAHEAGMFNCANIGAFNSDLVHMINSVKGDVQRTSRGELTASQASYAPLPRGRSQMPIRQKLPPRAGGDQRSLLQAQ